MGFIARQILLDGLARDNGIGELITAIAPLHPRHDTFPGEVSAVLSEPFDQVRGC
jgi:hypothetical protein